MNTDKILLVLVLINLIGFIIVAVDKDKARRRQWRIPEKTIFLIAMIGGCVGVYLSMLIFRHKTRHWYFMVGIPMIFILQVIAVYFLFYPL